MKVSITTHDTVEAKRILHIDAFVTLAVYVNSLRNKLVNEPDSFSKDRDRALEEVSDLLSQLLIQLKDETGDDLI